MTVETIASKCSWACVRVCGEAPGSSFTVVCGPSGPTIGEWKRRALALKGRQYAKAAVVPTKWPTVQATSTKSASQPVHLLHQIAASSKRIWHSLLQQIVLEPTTKSIFPESPPGLPKPSAHPRIVTVPGDAILVLKHEVLTWIGRPTKYLQLLCPGLVKTWPSSHPS